MSRVLRNTVLTIGGTGSAIAANAAWLSVSV